ncbi:alpha/beta fold hydrolase [Leptobacterium flavescens]|uniref:Alpha/beta fold hydrolase n=1 Tax=Leptobacterium flavescens TaxID=472055 RepID=A0A6P0UJW3_9FLAO|nr:alpha/beta hydrolase [Leptobacterium flavescens]NER13514.1 alpha/beta fold hydrolase [Leptobacterium flavescens]
MSKIKILILVNLFITFGIQAQFTKCTDLDNSDDLKSSFCTTIKVPLNYQSDNKDSISLFVRKFPSVKKKKGSIWLIPGGPGESGASLYPLVTEFSKIFPHLDIFIPDHRGTGFSSKICPKEEGVDSPNGIALVNQEWGTCFDHMYKNQSYVQAFNITNAANDLSFLINNLSGEGKQYIYGVSYGTQLVLRLLQLNSVNLDGVILDSLVPLQDDDDYDLSRRSFVVNDIGRSVLDFYDKQQPAGTPSLASQLQEIIQRSRTDAEFKEKIPVPDLAGLFGTMLDIPEVRNKIPEIIRALSADDLTPLNNAISSITEFYNSYGAKYKTSVNSIPLVQVISSSENNLRPELKKSEVATASKELLFTSPLPGLLAENSMPTYKKDAYFAATPDKMPPTLILHGTLDPKTHLSGATRHFEELTKNNNAITYIRIQDAPHFIALFAPDSFASIASKFIKGKKLENKVVRDSNTLLK